MVESFMLHLQGGIIVSTSGIIKEYILYLCHILVSALLCKIHGYNQLINANQGLANKCKEIFRRGKLYYFFPSNNLTVIS